MQKTKKQQKAEDRLIEQTYYRYGSGVQINIMDIPAIFRIGREAIDKGSNLDQAIQDAIAKFRKN